MDDNQLWALAWKVLGVCFCVMVITMAGCNGTQYSRFEKIVAAGADPIAAGCGIGIRTDPTLCALAVTNQSKK